MNLKKSIDIGDTIKIKQTIHKHYGQTFFVKDEPFIVFGKFTLIPKNRYNLKNKDIETHIDLETEVIQELNAYRIFDSGEVENYLSNFFVPCKMVLIEKL